MLVIVEGTLRSVEVNDLIGELKRSIFDGDCYLTANGRVLCDEETVESAGLREYNTVTLNVRLRGGKVHGSLARAGKVKAQTPKVEKQTEEKKKRKTGRAKRREQFNRRFVNIVPGARRRGPNSNQKDQQSQAKK